MRDKKEKILLDVDDVIVDNAFLDVINKFKGTNYKESDFDCYFVQEKIMDENEQKSFKKFMLEYNMYEHCHLVEGVKETLEIIKDSMDIYICSACVVKDLEKYSGIFFARKYEFLMKNFPYLDPNKIIFTSSKNNFVGFDYQVDDRIENLKGNIKHKLLFTRQHNKNIDCKTLKQDGIVRVQDWSEILDYIMCM